MARAPRTGRYEPDEFDRAAENREVDGAHRAPRSWFARALPWIAVVVLAPLAAWALFTFGLRSGVIPAPADALEELRGSAAASPVTPSATESLDPDTDLAVTVLDGTSDGTVAQDVIAELQGAGYAELTSADYDSANPATSTVYVRSAAEHDTAADVAARATEVLQEADPAAEPVVVVESAAAASSAPVVLVLRD